MRWVAEELGIKNFKATPTAIHLNAISPTSTIAEADLQISKTKTDIKTFITNKNIKSDQQFVTAVAYYYRFEAPQGERHDSINPEIAQDATRLVGCSRMTNPLATLNNAKRQGYLDSNTPGEFSINTVGENLVAMALSGSGAAGITGGKNKSAQPKGGIKKKTPKGK